MIPLWPVPDEWIDDDPVVFAPAPFGAFPGPVVKPRCRHCRLELSECPGGCSTRTGDRP